jgi:hypothetical protein
MPRRPVLLTIAIVLALPILFATVGGTAGAGLLLGVVLVAIGVGSMFFGARGAEDDG